MENLKPKQETAVTFENTIFVGNKVIFNGSEYKITSVDHKLPNSSDGGFYRILMEPLNGGLEEQFNVSFNEAQDWYLLYQNGKK